MGEIVENGRRGILEPFTIDVRTRAAYVGHAQADAGGCQFYSHYENNLRTRTVTFVSPAIVHSARAVLRAHRRRACVVLGILRPRFGYGRLQTLHVCNPHCAT